MPDIVIKALKLLCQYIRSLINVELVPEDFISAYNNNVDCQVVSVKFECTVLRCT